MKNFIDLGVQPVLTKALQNLGVIEPTTIQKKTIPIIFENRDIIAQAQTGTGKTLAFILPILEKVDLNKEYIQALIVTPTRELALQITSELKKLTSYLNDINVLAVYGGQDVEKQLKSLKRINQIVVATPGRLLDHLRRGTINLDQVSMFVLDEADQMLQMGFLPEVEDIMDNLPKEKQKMLFSATMPTEIKKLSMRFMRNPVEIHVKEENITVDKIKQLVIETTDRNKQDTLRYLLKQYHPFLGIIFCRTKRRAKTLNEALKSSGYLSDELHGDLSQAKREKVVKNFREAKLQYLVATDVAARGLDIEGITHVFNYDIPQDIESYIHRIGRTGRAGYEGMAITLVAPKDKQYLHMIEKGIKQTLEKTSVVLPNKKSVTTSGREGKQVRSTNGKKNFNSRKENTFNRIHRKSKDKRSR